MESLLCSDRWVTNLVTQPHLDGPHITGGVSPPHQDLLTLWHQPRHQLVVY